MTELDDLVKIIQSDPILSMAIKEILEVDHAKYYYHANKKIQRFIRKRMRTTEYKNKIIKNRIKTHTAMWLNQPLNSDAGLIINKLPISKSSDEKQTVIPMDGKI